MRNSHRFDYNQPSRDSLAGIYVEASDFGRGTLPAELPASQDKAVALAPVEQLFGITMSVDDDDTAAQHSRTPQA